MAESEIILEHPNRESLASRSTRAVIILLLLLTAVLLAIVTIGGWNELAGTKPELVAYVLIYPLLAWMVSRWSRGVLPVASGFAIILVIFAAVAIPGWFDRDATGFRDTTVDAAVLGMICVILIPLQVLLIGFCTRGFNQEWNVEIERTPGSSQGTPQTA